MFPLLAKRIIIICAIYKGNHFNHSEYCRSSILLILMSCCLLYFVVVFLFRIDVTVILYIEYI